MKNGCVLSKRIKAEVHTGLQNHPQSQKPAGEESKYNFGRYPVYEGLSLSGKRRAGGEEIEGGKQNLKRCGMQNA